MARTRPFTLLAVAAIVTVSSPAAQRPVHAFVNHHDSSTVQSRDDTNEINEDSTATFSGSNKVVMVPASHQSENDQHHRHATSKEDARSLVEMELVAVAGSIKVALMPTLHGTRGHHHRRGLLRDSLTGSRSLQSVDPTMEGELFDFTKEPNGSDRDGSEFDNRIGPNTNRQSLNQLETGNGDNDSVASSNIKDKTWIWILVGVLGGLFVCCSGIAAYFYCCKRERESDNDDDDNDGDYGDNLNGDRDHIMADKGDHEQDQNTIMSSDDHQIIRIQSIDESYSTNDGKSSEAATAGETDSMSAVFAQTFVEWTGGRLGAAPLTHSRSKELSC